MVDNIYENTALKELCVAKPVVRNHESIYAYRTVYWRIKSRKTDKQDDWKTNTDWKALYNLCCKHCGYITTILFFKLLFIYNALHNFN